MQMLVLYIYIVYTGLGCNIDQIYITISFHPNNPKFKHLSLLSGKVIFPKFQNVSENVSISAYSGLADAIVLYI
jgi:hypothetical protein